MLPLPVPDPPTAAGCGQGAATSASWVAAFALPLPVMTTAAAPVLIAYDGSDAARRAISETAELFSSRSVLVATVWEEGLAYSAAAMPTAGLELQPVPADFGEAQKIGEELQARARRIAEGGAELARSAGLQAEAFAVAGDFQVADAIVERASPGSAQGWRAALQAGF
jgi:nucleotide-binding universal stress UspA family protein